MDKIYYDNKSAAFDWKERDLNNTDDPSCEECGSPDIQYYCTLEEGNRNTDYLICNECKHIFEANLR